MHFKFYYSTNLLKFSLIYYIRFTTILMVCYSKFYCISFECIMLFWCYFICLYYHDVLSDLDNLLDGGLIFGNLNVHQDEIILNVLEEYVEAYLSWLVTLILSPNLYKIWKFEFYKLLYCEN